jgi:catechol 2,3-dioxygenase-like lactoylglutathione lyase family enzyme
MAGKSNHRPYINPRFRAYGRARIDIAQRAQTRQDWDRMWKKPQYPFVFEWGEPWKQCIEYRVDDFAAEVGFMIDVLGLPVRAFSAEFAMFTSPDEAFNFAVVPTPPGIESTPPDAFRLQFMLNNLFDACQALAQRGIIFDQQAQPVSPNAHLWIAAFRTPHGIPVELWSMVEMPDADLDMSDPQADVAFIEAYTPEVELGSESVAEEDGYDAAFEAARRRVASERPELANSQSQFTDEVEEDHEEPLPPSLTTDQNQAQRLHARPSAPVQKPPLKIHKSGESMLSSINQSSTKSHETGNSLVRLNEPTYESLDENEEHEPETRRFPQEYHYRPIRLEDAAQEGEEL